MERVALKGDNLNGEHPAGLVVAPITGYIGTGSDNVYINGTPAARVGDTTYEWCSLHNELPVFGMLVYGSQKVFINGKSAAYAMKDIRPHAGTARLTGGGSSNVFIV